ncbi:hypothetical protein J2S03_003354 [Alicyclobacillus cycloheptanicus]|uniref:Uncharacterized protein n=1 Tax=Alicyclobacillus cycloheptanicus TaxID=1457 RepID=A0ABT9XMD4_9BACL|nr:hypothetical protein [Alicyclobacillus cycloheptanicus]
MAFPSAQGNGRVVKRFGGLPFHSLIRGRNGTLVCLSYVLIVSLSMQMSMRTWYIGYCLRIYLVFTVGTSVRTSMPTIYVGRLT